MHPLHHLWLHQLFSAESQAPAITASRVSSQNDATASVPPLTGQADAHNAASTAGPAGMLISDGPAGPTSAATAKARVAAAEGGQTSGCPGCHISFTRYPGTNGSTLDQVEDPVVRANLAAASLIKEEEAGAQSQAAQTAG